MPKKKPEHRYTQAERKKIYGLKKIKIKVKADVPKEKSERRKIIKEAYKTHPRIVYCPALESNVAINKSISSNKTFAAAAANRKSTIFALSVPELIERATLVYDNRSKLNPGQDSFDAVFILIAAVKNVGYAKITIGRYKPEITDTRADYCQYCVSHLTLHTIKNKE